MSDRCVQLHVHNSHSFLDGLAPAADLVARAAELGQPGIGLTNHGHLFAAPPFFSACKQHGIKGVIGMEAYEAVPHTWDPDPEGPHVRLFKEEYDVNKPRYYHLTLWAMNQQGWENLCAIHTKSYTKDYKPKNQPLVDRATLEQHHEGIIVGLGCPQSRTNRALERDYNQALAAAKWYFDVFDDRVYVEVMSVLPEQVRMLSDQRKLAKYFNRPTLGVNDVHYVWKKDGAFNGPHHTLVMARKYKSAAVAETETGDASDEAFGSWYGADGFYMKSRDEMIQAGIFPAEIDVSLEILDRVEFDFYAMPEPKPPTAHIPGPGVDLEFDAFVAAQ